MKVNPFLNGDRRLRNGWWILVFLVLLGGLIVSASIATSAREGGLPQAWQASMVAAVSLVCQGLRGRPVSELLGRLEPRRLVEFLLGLCLGSMLMLIPALLLFLAGYVHWHFAATLPRALLSEAGVLAIAALTEELMFRGFLFQRLIAGLGVWPAQAIVALFFLLIHLDGLNVSGWAKVLACCNIMLASVLFGYAYLRTASLAMPLGMHWMANVTQGLLLGLGVSGHREAGFLVATQSGGPAWLTGSDFGLEASAPGLLMVLAMTIAMHRWRRASVQL